MVRKGRILANVQTEDYSLPRAGHPGFHDAQTRNLSKEDVRAVLAAGHGRETT